MSRSVRVRFQLGLAAECLVTEQCSRPEITWVYSNVELYQIERFVYEADYESPIYSGRGVPSIYL